MSSETKQIIRRKEAKNLGLRRYFTGKPCKNGHICERYCNNSHCVICELDVCAKYRAVNRETLREKNKVYKSTRKNQIAEKNKRYRNENIAKILERDRLYRLAHTETIRAKNKAYRERKKHDIKKVPNKLWTPLHQRLANPIPAPNWSLIRYDMTTTLQRAERYRDIYRSKKNLRDY